MTMTMTLKYAYAVQLHRLVINAGLRHCTAMMQDVQFEQDDTAALN